MSGRGGFTRTAPAIGVNRRYLVKINLIPAISSTAARKSEISRTAKRLLPKCEPMMPPMIAAAARMNPREGMDFREVAN